ncbi:putative amino-acid transport protein [Salmonella enterica subsp. arizonae]|uniref:Putative amino-acid transport protein n=1 Tax=Salmonella enterica subsp. arizonae TaxID=59203 RepID=A0A2X4TJI1_SALER|nr:putative amino-acid transport protein [Salmonella enterica subsp. arizonae]
MPMMAETHIQKTAPGPPAAIASDTPARLPLPIRAARLVHSA